MFKKVLNMYLCSISIASYSSGSILMFGNIGGQKERISHVRFR